MKDVRRVAARSHFSRDMVGQHAANWRALLGHLAGFPALRFLEIGSFEGCSAVWWLRNLLTHDLSTLVCIDPWVWYPRTEGAFDRNIAASGAAHKVRKFKAESRSVLADFPRESLDFIYVDGSHRARDVLLDGLMAFPLLKHGGIMIFDDYEIPPAVLAPTDFGVGGAAAQPNHHPKFAVDTFLALTDDTSEVVLKGYQVAVRKRSPCQTRSASRPGLPVVEAQPPAR